MGLTRVTPQSDIQEPVTIDQVKARLRIEGDRSDEDLGYMIKTAREVCEHVSGRQFVTSVFDYTMKAFPVGEIILPISPLVAVSNIAYYDTNNDPQTWDADCYEADITQLAPRIRPVSGKLYPSNTYDRYDAVTVTFTAGYGARSDVPGMAKQAILYEVAHLDAMREPVIVGTGTISAMEVPRTVQLYLDRISVPKGF